MNNYGVFGVDGSAAIINHPEVAILGMGRVIDRPWVVDGQLAVRKVTELTLAFDHRVCDGWNRLAGSSATSPTAWNRRSPRWVACAARPGRACGEGSLPVVAHGLHAVPAWLAAAACGAPRRRSLPGGGRRWPCAAAGGDPRRRHDAQVDAGVAGPLVSYMATICSPARLRAVLTRPPTARR